MITYIIRSFCFCEIWALCVVITYNQLYIIYIYIDILLQQLWPSPSITSSIVYCNLQISQSKLSICSLANNQKLAISTFCQNSITSDSKEIRYLTVQISGNGRWQKMSSVCSCRVTYAFQSESTLYSSLNVTELLVWSRHKIWSLSDCNGTRTQSHLVRKRTLNHLASLTKCLSVRLQSKLFWVRVQLQSLKKFRL